MLLTVTEVVFQAVASILEDIVTLIFGLPARPTRLSNSDDIIIIDLIVGHPGIEIQLLAGIWPGDGQFTPVNLKGVRASA
jgi:hypothetical protein